MLLAIDPGNIESAYVEIDKDYQPVWFDKVPNGELLNMLTYKMRPDYVAIEMVASYGMAVGQEVFETVFWIGRFWQAATANMAHCTKIFRKDVKLNLCQNTRAKDANIRQALIDRFGQVGTKKAPGWFYGFKSDIWSAYACGVTYLDGYERARQFALNAPSVSPERVLGGGMRKA